MQRLGELGVVSACDLTTEACCAKIGELEDLACYIVTEVSKQAARTVWRRRVVQTLVRLTRGSPVPGCILTLMAAAYLFGLGLHSAQVCVAW